MKNCSVPQCDKKAYARGYCVNHYRKYVWYPKYKITGPIKDKGRCSHDGCDGHVYCKGLCRSHYYYSKHPKNHTVCAVPGCERRVRGNKYCCDHQYRIERGKPLWGKLISKGEHNHRWAGGVAFYKDHYAFKKIRRELLDACDGRCGCGDKAWTVWHKNGDRNDHSKSNLKVLCRVCWRNVRTRAGVTQYIRAKKIYGMSFIDMVHRWGHTTVWYSRRHKRGLLGDFLNSKIADKTKWVYA